MLSCYQFVNVGFSVNKGSNENEAWSFAAISIRFYLFLVRLFDYIKNLALPTSTDGYLLYMHKAFVIDINEYDEVITTNNKS